MEYSKEIVVYKIDSDSSPLGFMFDGETIWLTQEQIASVFGIDRTSVSRHIKNIYDEGELDALRTSAEIARVVDKKRTYQITHYNLDVVISVGYRVNSKEATKFRQWATQIVRERIIGSATGTISADEQRVMVSDRVAVENNELVDSARKLGVDDDAAFLNAGYQGMYGMKMGEIKKKKGLGEDRLLDRAGITELAANEFRITQANALLKDYLNDDGILVGHGVALQTHWQVGQHVREAIGNIGGTLPEELRIEPDHISEVRKRVLTAKVKPKELNE